MISKDSYAKFYMENEEKTLSYHIDKETRYQIKNILIKQKMAKPDSNLVIMQNNMTQLQNMMTEIAKKIK
jgi:hypothetical protein